MHTYNSGKLAGTYGGGLPPQILANPLSSRLSARSATLAPLRKIATPTHADGKRPPTPPTSAALAAAMADHTQYGTHMPTRLCRPTH